VTRAPVPSERWILLRGLGREAGHWDGFPQALRAAFPGATVLTPDLPGCGSRHREVAPASVPALAEAVRQSVDAATITPGDRVAAPKTWLLGLSLGAMVALEWARLHPYEIAGVVLVNGSSGRLSPFWRRMRPAALLGLARALLAPSLARREERIFAITSTRPDRADVAVAAWVALAEAHPVRAANLGRLLLAAATYRPLPGPLAGPASLVVVGAGDRLAHPTCSGRLADALAAPLAVHPTAGHELPLDDPEWLVAQLVSWRARREESSPDRHTVTIA
jgi:pimeloyl-ACP methyl ester carboxylesterase